ncbi:MAG TPA: formylglycine-generating enzyme family protein [Terriglobales bacterium]|jgi:formylglycine-generating enzyme required for sulfatase activity|nr:formylglycine-generating enzyme family protein [Terriglobales bacterium]
MKTSNALLVAATLVLLAFSAYAQDTDYKPKDEQIPPPPCFKAVHPWWDYDDEKPCTRADIDAWLKDVTHYRKEVRIRAGYSDAEYRRPELKWTQSSFIQPQVMMEDRYLYDPVAGKYTVDRYLDDVEKRYGGVDAVLLWHTYPNIGIDNRNQYDLLRALPGGVAGVKQMVADFHRRNVKVFFPIMLWDQGTRDPGEPNWDATAKLMAEVGADGINGDTLHGVPRAFRTASDAVGHPLALEPEDGPDREALAWNNLTWGYWQYPQVPWVSLYKWLEPRHMVNVCDRWNRSKVDNLQFAFFNGVGYESWENVWGIWNGITPRDAEALRRVAKIERAQAEFLVSADWQPFAWMEQHSIFASRWPKGDDTLWTIINRSQYNVDGRQMRLPAQAGLHYYDLWNGKEITPETEGSDIFLSFAIEANGFGAILATKSGSPKLSPTQPLSTYSSEWRFLPQHLVEIPKTQPESAAPAGMVKIPAADFAFKIDGIELERGDQDNDIGVDVQYPWEDSPRTHHVHTVHVDSFYIDKYPVTNAEFKKFVDTTHYHPKDDLNFLHEWKDGNYPRGWDNKPVTWVSQEDARAYADWAGKRLPHEWEWQYAAQGTDGRAYPWGNDWNDSAVPVKEKSRVMREPDAVDMHPSGASPFGVQDLVGNVWQWTDEYVDEHTRAAILRGGSNYRPQGSSWYFPPAYRNDQHGKLLLMAPGKDRAGTLGFRCVKDSAAQ